jgi:hypothetical protein
MPLATRDPLSPQFDGKARALIRRADARREQWTGSHLAAPTIEQRARASLMGVWNLYEIDRWGEARWVRAYKRAVYYQLRADWPGIALEWNRTARSARGGFRWLIQVRAHAKSSGAYQREAARVLAEYGPGSGKHSSIDDHDWE